VAETPPRTAAGAPNVIKLIPRQWTLLEPCQAKFSLLKIDGDGLSSAVSMNRQIHFSPPVKRRQAEAEREKRSRVLLAEGEFLAAEQLTNAGAQMAQQPTALQLRYLETLTEIAAEKNSTILFPVPIDILQGLTDLLTKH